MAKKFQILSNSNTVKNFQQVKVSSFTEYTSSPSVSEVKFWIISKKHIDNIFIYHTPGFLCHQVQVRLPMQQFQA